MIYIVFKSIEPISLLFVSNIYVNIYVKYRCRERFIKDIRTVDASDILDIIIITYIFKHKVVVLLSFFDASTEKQPLECHP